MTVRFADFSLATDAGGTMRETKTCGLVKIDARIIARTCKTTDFQLEAM